MSAEQLPSPQFQEVEWCVRIVRIKDKEGGFRKLPAIFVKEQGQTQPTEVLTEDNCYVCFFDEKPEMNHLEIKDPDGNSRRMEVKNGSLWGACIRLDFRRVYKGRPEQAVLDWYFKTVDQPKMENEFEQLANCPDLKQFHGKIPNAASLSEVASSTRK